MESNELPVVNELSKCGHKIEGSIRRNKQKGNLLPLELLPQHHITVERRNFVDHFVERVDDCDLIVTIRQIRHVLKFRCSRMEVNFLFG